jgi:protein O-mannosyl-transferase
MRRTVASSPARVHLVMALILAGTLHPFLIGLKGQFNYDDYLLIISNPAIRSWSGLSTVLVSGRPLRGLTLMLDYQLYGLDAAGYHLTNMVWHYLGLLLLYSLAYRLYGRVVLAGAAAIMFGLHPIHSEAVMGITHRKEMLAFCFLLLSYHAYLYRPRFPKAALGLGAFFFLIGLLAKQVVMVLPVLLAAHELIFHPEQRNWRRWGWALGLGAAVAALVVAGSLWRAPVLRDFNPLGLIKSTELGDLPYGRIVSTSLSVIPRHLRYLFFPVHMNVDHQVPIVDFSDPAAWLGLGWLLALIGAMIGSRRDRVLGFGLAWVFINLLPVLNVIPSNYFFAERYLYIPSAGSCLVVAGMLERLFRGPARLWGRRGYAAASGAVWFLALALVLLMPWLGRLSAIWLPLKSYRMDPSRGLLAGAALAAAAGVAGLAAVERILKRRQRWWLEYALYYALFGGLMALTVLAAEFMIQGRWGLPKVDVEGNFSQILGWLSGHGAGQPHSERYALQPAFTPLNELIEIFVYIVGFPALVFCLVRRRRRTEAAAHPNRALALDLFVLWLLANGAMLNLRNGDWASDISLWRSAIAEAPHSLNAWNNLGRAYSNRQRYGPAEAALQQVVRLAPQDPRGWSNLGMARARITDFEGARTAFERAVELAPYDPTAAHMLANCVFVLAMRSRDRARVQAVVPLYFRVLELDPGSAHARYNLAKCFLALEERDLALEQAEAALSIDPGNGQYRVLVERLRALP